MSSIGASCAHVYMMKKRQEEKLKAGEAERVSKGGGAVAAVGKESAMDRPMVGKSTNKVHPSSYPSPTPRGSSYTDGQIWYWTGSVSRCL